MGKIMATDAFDREIRVGDTVIVARAWGRSCSLAAGIVTEITDKKVFYEVVMDKGSQDKASYGKSVGDITHVGPYMQKGDKYDKIITVGYGFDHDPMTHKVMGEIFVK